MQTQAKLKLSESQADKEDSMSIVTSDQKQKGQKSSVIVEFPLKNKKMISQDKLSLCEKISQIPKSSKISEADLTSNEKGLKPYWTDLSKEISSLLWLPTKTALQDLDRKSSNIFSQKMVENSWFLTELNIAQQKNSQKIFSQSFTSSLVECTGSEDILRKSKKIRIYPTKEQGKIFQQWFGVSRFSYNRGVEFLKQPGTKANWKKIKTGIIHNLPTWADPTPYQIKSLAIRDACKAISKAKKDFLITGELQEVKFRSKKNPIQSCYIPKSALIVRENKVCGIYPTLSEGGMKFTEEVPKNHHDCRLVLENGRYFICVSYNSKQQLFENQGRVVSLDPGIRNFITFFSETSCGKLGQSDFSRIQRLCTYLDRLLSKKAKRKDRFFRKHIQKAIQRMRARIRNLVDELHHKVALFLVKNFDIILLPSFETSKMAMKSKRKIQSKSVRSMLTFAHYRFKQFLNHKAFEHGKIVLEVNEAYTSKTVSWTGEIINNLGGRKVIKSRLDKQEMDRDYNGARGIFLRALGDQPILKRNLQNTSASRVTPLVAFGSEK